MTMLFVDSVAHYSANPTKYDNAGSVPGTVTVADGGNGTRALSWSDAGWGLLLTQARLKQGTLWSSLGTSLITGANMVLGAPGANLQLLRCGDIYLLLTHAMRLEVWYKPWHPTDHLLLKAPSATIPAHSYIEWAVGQHPLSTSLPACVVMVNEAQYTAFRDTHCVMGDVYLGPEGQASGSVGGVSVTMGDIYVADNNGNAFPGTQTSDFAGHVTTRYLRPNADASAFNLEWTHVGPGHHYEGLNELVDPDGSAYIYRDYPDPSHGDSHDVYFTELAPLTAPNPDYVQVVYAGSPADATGALAHPTTAIGALYSNGLGGFITTGPSLPVPTANTVSWQYYWATTAQYANGGGGVHEKDYWNGVGVDDGAGSLQYAVIGVNMPPNSLPMAAFQVAQVGVELAYRGHPGTYTFPPPTSGRTWAQIVG